MKVKVKRGEYMTKNEALEKIKELEDYIRWIDNPIGFKDDEIFLLSAEVPF